MDRLREMDRPERPGLRWTRPEQWHVTLRFYGSVAPEQVRALAGDLAQAASAAAPATAVSGPSPVALGPHVWALPVAGLEELAAPLCVGESRPFRGHLALARARRRGALSGLPAPALVESWRVEEVCLVESDLRADGARYEVVGRWRLGGG